MTSRVLYIGKDYTTHDRRFLEALSGNFETYFLRVEENRASFEEMPLPGGVRIVKRSSEKALLSVRNALDTLLPSAVFAGPVPTIGNLAARAGSPGLIAVSWGSDLLVDTRRDHEARKAASFAIEHADLFVCDCDAVQEAAAELAPLPEVVKLPWGTEPSVFTPGSSALRHELGWQDCHIVLSLRSWEPVYDVLTVVHAFQRAFSSDPSLRLLLLGDGSLASDVHEAVQKAGLEEVVHCPGWVASDQLPVYYRAADVYVSAALSDGSSVSLLEAMSTGLPVVVTDIPSNREWVPVEEGGWCVPAGDEIQFAEAMLAGATLPEAARSAVSLRHRSIIRERACWPENVERLLGGVTSVVMK